MIRLFFNIINVACHQAWNNKKNYIFLSVTIVLTFSIIGFYMIYNDSNIYNKYKTIMRESSRIVFVNYDKTEQNKVNLLLSKLEKLENTHYYLTSEFTDITLFDNKVEHVNFKLIAKVVPNNVWAYYWGSGYRVEMIDGDKGFSLKDDEIIVCESLYKLINGNRKNDEDIFLNLSSGKKLKITNVCRDFSKNNKVVDENGVISYYFYGFISDKCLENIESVNDKIVIYSVNVTEIEEYARNLGLAFSSYYDEKQEMNKEIIDSIEIKEVVLISLMIILGINMLSSFLNALSERKYEISIRRALGASKYSIVLQFLTEGILVIAIDVLVSVAVIMILLASIKLYHALALGDEWIINITSYSALIFFLCCTFLALFFSGLFSILSTRVEIIKYIKSE